MWTKTHVLFEGGLSPSYKPISWKRRTTQAAPWFSGRSFEDFWSLSRPGTVREDLGNQINFKTMLGRFNFFKNQTWCQANQWVLWSKNIECTRYLLLIYCPKERGHLMKACARSNDKMWWTNVSELVFSYFGISSTILQQKGNLPKNCLKIHQTLHKTMMTMMYGNLAYCSSSSLFCSTWS